jgi:hypothetical protein
VVMQAAPVLVLRLGANVVGQLLFMFFERMACSVLIKSQGSWCNT